MIWDTVCSALLPIPLRELAAVLLRVVAHIQRANERGRRPRQCDITRKLLRVDSQPATTLASVGGA
jgi:hypothetical protein